MQIDPKLYTKCSPELLSPLILFCIPNNKMHTYKDNVKLINGLYMISVENIKQTLTMTNVDETP
jgi:hypothetical protein